MRFSLLLLVLVAAPAAGLNLMGRRACLLGAGACMLPKAASASYALGAANEAQHTWQATSKEAERKVYESIESELDKKRRFRDDAGTLGYVGGEYTNYRRGAGRDAFEASKKKTDSSSPYMSAGEYVGAAAMRRMAAP